MKGLSTVNVDFKLDIPVLNNVDWTVCFSEKQIIFEVKEIGFSWHHAVVRKVNARKFVGFIQFFIAIKSSFQMRLYV